MCVAASLPTFPPSSILKTRHSENTPPAAAGASRLRRDFHFTECPEEAGHKQAEHDLKFFLSKAHGLTCCGLPGSIWSYGEMRKYMMRDFMNITKALSDESRVRALLALRQGELCVCQITELFGFAPSTISKHLSILFQAGLVESRKEGRWIYYQLPGKNAPAAVREALAWIEKALADSPQALEDNKKLNIILKQDPVDLCKRQCQK